jgi:choline-phosphate cytidylyltransferase
MIRNDAQRILRGGIVGCGRIANRFMVESRFVSGIVFDSVCDLNKQQAESFAKKHTIKDVYDDYDEMLSVVDVVYVATPHPFHAEYVRKALNAKKHVLCEKPLTLDYDEAKDLYALAESKGVVLQEALKTAFAPCFKRLVNLAKGGVIGRVRQVNATFTRLTSDKSLREFDPNMGGGAISELASYVLCPIVKLLGPATAEQMTIHSLRDEVDRVETFATGMIRYPAATGVFTVGFSAKSEGALTIAGTTGYIYVPSPWWKTEYFEIRNDMGQTVRRVFSPFVGDGLRYELADFVRAVITRNISSAWEPEDSIALLNLLIKARS